MTTAEKTLRALIVEDSEDDATLLVRELRRGGYEPEYERVETPEAMEAALASSEWAVILSDYRMPRFGANEALSMARSLGSDAPFIVVSGKVGEDAAVDLVKAGAHDYVMKDDLVRLCAAVERGVKEAGERSRAAKELRRRDAILEAVRFVADRFLGGAGDWEKNITAALARLGEATGASRAYIFENYEGDDGAAWTVQRHEWVAPGVAAQAGNPDLDALPYRAAGLGRWEETLSRGEPLHGNVRDYPRSERPGREAQGILSQALVPIFVEGRWWGFIGFDECFREREWSAAELDALGAAASTLGAAIRGKRIEEVLSGSEERYRAVIERATDGIYLLDSGTKRIVETNPSFQRMLGYSAGEMRGMEVYDFVAHQREDVEATIRHTLREKRRVVGERKYRKKDGSLVDVEVGVSVISLGGDETICTIVRDVTERKQNEEKLRASEAELRAVLGAINDVIFVLDGEGRHLEIPQTNTAIKRRPPAGVLGKTLHETLPKEVADAILDGVRRALDTRRSVDLEHSLQAGERRRWYATTISPMLEGTVVAVARDITERKEAEERLRASEAGLANSQRVAHLGNWAWDLRSNEARWSDELYRIHGFAPQDPVPTWDEFLNLVHPADRERVDGSFHAALREGESYDIEHRILRPDGSERVVRCQLEADFDESGRAVRAVGTVHDITERKRDEEALRQSERLYRTVISQATENIFLVDVGTRRIVESNPAFRSALGYSEDELRRMTLHDVVAESRESVEENIRLVVEQETPFVGERRYRRRDGSLMSVEVSASRVLLDGRETLCAVAHDVTERARIQALLEERVATLSSIASSLTLDAPVEDTLRALAESVMNASTATTYLIMLADEEAGGVRLVGSYGVPEGYHEGLQAAFEAGGRSPVHEAIRTRRPVTFREAHAVVEGDPLYAPIHPFADGIPEDTIHILPLVFRGRAIGAIAFGYLPEREPSEDEKTFLRVVADQTAVAVENARLFSEARDMATLEERQRLARDLHDSVSQALYGIVLGAKTARESLPDDPERAVEPLDYTLSLARAGLAEMRSLIFELMPESLEKEGLVAALEKQAAAIKARHGIATRTVLCKEEPEASPKVKEAAYRIVQEALHNTAKHARAEHVEIHLECLSGSITLEVCDDGVGFDPDGEYPGHLGLRSMRERTSSLGGSLEVYSAPGGGTRVRARIPV